MHDGLLHYIVVDFNYFELVNIITKYVQQVFHIFFVINDNKWIRDILWKFLQFNFVVFFITICMANYTSAYCFVSHAITRNCVIILSKEFVKQTR